MIQSPSSSSLPAIESIVLVAIFLEKSADLVFHEVKPALSSSRHGCGIRCIHTRTCTCTCILLVCFKRRLPALLSSSRIDVHSFIWGQSYGTIGRSIRKGRYSAHSFLLCIYLYFIGNPSALCNFLIL